MAEKIIILLPFLNDEESLNRLLTEMGDTLKEFQEAAFSVLIVDDGSSDDFKIAAPTFFSVQVLHLQRNIGHQKAIAVGLAYIKENIPCGKVLVMDADGEDRPPDAASLLKESTGNPDKIIFAQRKSRQQTTHFKFFYRLYKFVFRLLTGKKIAFGNFMVLPRRSLEKIVYYSEIWNHLAGGILKAGLPYSAILTHRGKRYAGKSRMSFHSLLMHGLGAIAVFTEVIASRLLVFSLVLIGISLLAILALIGTKSFTDLAIPGWTSTVISAMLIILLQSFLLSLFTIFLYLSSQSQRKFIPAQHYKDYTGLAETIQ
ncbi:MAG: glycosyltransferase family 2 protein [Sphingobacteriales bacterium]|nr:glycosyltransferase family 2 protein [Sphingobacteriales bacterium]